MFVYKYKVVLHNVTTDVSNTSSFVGSLESKARHQRARGVGSEDGTNSRWEVVAREGATENT